MEITLTTSSSCKEDPRKLQGAGCDIWGDKRLALALKTKEIIKDLEHPWFIESGTLLGAWRSGKFIPHDDDFDIALFLSRSAASAHTATSLRFSTLRRAFISCLALSTTERTTTS